MGSCENCAEKRLNLQRQFADHDELSGVPEIVGDVLRSPGQPLDSSTRLDMESRFGHDFSSVRVHTDARAAQSARAVHSTAYTVGSDVVFGAGRYTPATTEGQRLLAHELTHVVQQRGVGKPGDSSLRIGPEEDTSESEAERVSQSIVAGNFVPFGRSAAEGLMQRQFSSESSESESSGAGVEDAGTGATAGGSCKIDVRATHIGGVLSRTPIWHLFIVYTDGAGTEFYFRAGPGGSCPGVTGGYGTIIGTSGRYVAGTVDWDPGAPSTTVMTGASACGKDSCFTSELARIDGTCTPYAATGPNSNTAAKTLLSKCSVPKNKPVLIAPGWGDPDL